MLPLIFVAILLLTSSAEAAPQKCQGTHILYTTMLHNAAVTISADLTISVQQNTSNFVSITNISGTAGSSSSFTKMCVTERTSTYNNDSICNSAFTSPINITLGDGVLELAASIFTSGVGSESILFYSSIVDQQSFSFFDGKLFDDNNKCQTYINPQDNAFNVTECCTAMTAINVPASPAPLCTKFSSTTRISNTADNSTYASLTFNAELLNNNLTMIGKYSGGPNYVPYILINDAQGCEEVYNNMMYCGYPLFTGGTKLMMFLTEDFIQNPPITLIDRLIFRDNQAFMNDVTPFSSTNMCQTFEFAYGTNQKAKTDLCCTEFQMTSTVASSTTPSTTTVASSNTSSSTVSQSSTTGKSGSSKSLNVDIYVTLMAIFAAIAMIKA